MERWVAVLLMTAASTSGEPAAHLITEDDWAAVSVRPTAASGTRSSFDPTEQAEISATFFANALRSRPVRSALHSRTS